MKIEDKRLTLKNGTTATLACPQASDAAALLAYIKQTFGESEFLSRYPEEMEGFSVERESKWIDSHLSSPNALLLACYADGRIVGNCTLTRLAGQKMQHRATVAIAILRDFWGLSIGSAMLDVMLETARAWGVEIVELEFIEGNERAQRLYEKKGFVIVGSRPNIFKLRDGSTRGEYFMQKQL